MPWADSTFLACASVELQRPIHVYASGGDVRPIAHVFQPRDMSLAPPLAIGYVDSSHYVALAELPEAATSPPTFAVPSAPAGGRRGKRTGRAEPTDAPSAQQWQGHTLLKLALPRAGILLQALVCGCTVCCGT